MTLSAPVQGCCAPGFERVRAEFERNFTERRDLGAAVAVTVGGETVVDLWGGHRDATAAVPWQRDTIVNIYSAGKALAALGLHLLADRGDVDLDAPVARYWPEFARAGKGHIPVRWLLSHRAGLIGPRRTLAPGDLYDWDGVCAALADSRPWWRPGAAQGYHAVTFGFLVGEVVRRVTGMSLGSYLRTTITEPLRADAFIGLSTAEQLRCADLDGQLDDARMAELVPGLPAGPVRELTDHPLAALRVVLSSIPGDDVNTARWRSAEVPSSNAHASARGLAAVYGAVAGGVLLRRSTVDAMRRRQGEAGETDLVLGPVADPRTTFAWGLGFMPNIHGFAGPNPAAFGHGGAGGSYAFADPENQVSYAYVTNRYRGGGTGGDPRSTHLVKAVYAALAEMPVRPAA